LTPRERAEYELLQAGALRRLGCKFKRYFPDCLPGCKPGLAVADHVVRPGHQRPNCRVLYQRSLIFFAAGFIRRERLFLAANRTSKTVSAAFELTAHLIHDYPDWWPGRRFDEKGDWWAAGDTRETTRDIVQLELLGTRDEIRSGTYASGMVPAHRIYDRTLKTGVADCVDTVWIKHVERHHGAPCTSTVQFKSYDQGRKSFQGTSQDGIWLDEEPPDVTEDASSGGTPSGNGDIYTECLLRTATTDGLVIATFTPLRGLTPFVDQFLETAEMADAASGHIINAKVGIFGAPG
jgi:phage terminase large subunit-like protein